MAENSERDQYRALVGSLTGAGYQLSTSAKLYLRGLTGLLQQIEDTRELRRQIQRIHESGAWPGLGEQANLIQVADAQLGVLLYLRDQAE